jgi:hypothetical protein
MKEKKEEEKKRKKQARIGYQLSARRNCLTIPAILPVACLLRAWRSSASAARWPEIRKETKGQARTSEARHQGGCALAVVVLVKPHSKAHAA